MWRGDLSGEDPARRPQRDLQICRGRLPVPDAQEGCHDASHHLAQERIACHVDRDGATLPADPHPVEGPDRLSMLAAECGEVMPPDQHPCGAVHGWHVERLPDPQGVPLAQRASRSVPDGVPVLPTRRRATWREVGCHPVQPPDRDIRRQDRPDGPTEHLCPDPTPVPGECDDLAAGVDPGVGPARPVDPDPPPAADAAERRLQLSLDGPPPRLYLEAGEPGPVIFHPRGVPREATLSGGWLKRARAGRWGHDRRPESRSS